MGEKRFDLVSEEPLSPWSPGTAKDLLESPVNRGPTVQFRQSMDDKYSTYHGRGRENDSLEGRIGKRYASDREICLRDQRFSEYENVDRIRHLVVDRRSRSPRRTEKRIDYDRDDCMATRRVSGYDAGKYESNHSGKVNDTHSSRIYYEQKSHAGEKMLPSAHHDGPRRSDQLSMKDYYDHISDNYKGRGLVDDRGSRSPRRTVERSNFGRNSCRRVSPKYSGYDDDKYVSKAGDRHLSRIYCERSCHAGSSAQNLPGHPSDGRRKSDHFSMKDDVHMPDFYRACNTNIIGGGDGRSDYIANCYSGSNQAGLVYVSEYPDRGKQLSPDYDGGRRLCSYSDVLASGGVPDLPRRDISGGGSGCHMSSLESQHLNPAIDNQNHLCLQDALHLDKREREIEMRSGRPEIEGVLHEKIAGGVRYNMEKEYVAAPSKGYSARDYDGLISSSPPNPYASLSSGLLREGFSNHSAAHGLHASSHAVQRESGLAKKGDIFVGGLGNQSGDTRMNSRSYTQQPEGRRAYKMHTEFEKSQIDQLVKWTNNTEEGYEDYSMHKNDIFDSAMQESPHGKHTIDDRAPDYVSHLRSVNDNFDTQRTLHSRKCGVDLLCNAPSSVDYSATGYSDGIIIQEEHQPEMQLDNWFPVERSDISASRVNDHAYTELYDGGFCLTKPSEESLRHTHIRDEISYGGAAGIRICMDENGARKIYSREELTSSSIYPSHFSQSPHRSDSRDIKKRLGPRVPPSPPGPKHLAKKYKPSSKLSGSVPLKNGSTLSWLKPSIRSRIAITDEGLGGKVHNSDEDSVVGNPPLVDRLGPRVPPSPVLKHRAKKNKPSRNMSGSVSPENGAAFPWLESPTSNRIASVREGLGEKVHDSDKDNAVDNPPLIRPEPPEKSEEFRKLLEKEFFKFLKQINETPSRRKKYVEPGNAGSLKCLVCSSNSGVFVDTESLALHAFTSKTVGYRSQHLGLHKALCVLMGWKTGEGLDGGWHREVLPKAEISALKEDLIIWPPVVIVHNGTVGNKNPDERDIISTERLEKKLKDMGFRCILKVWNGKPANQGVLLVKFKPTLSGLEEAERLHQGYVAANKGRRGFKHSKSRNTTSTGEAQESAPQSDDDNLYGYLGLSGDLVKLDFSTKNQCRLRSKKEVLSIVDAPLGTVGS